MSNRKKISASPASPQASRQSINNTETLCLFFIMPTCSECVCCLFGQADPVLADITQVCQEVDQETPQEPAEASTQVRENLLFSSVGCFLHVSLCILFSSKLYLFCFQNSSLLLLADCPAPTAEVGESSEVNLVRLSLFFFFFKLMEVT